MNLLQNVSLSNVLHTAQTSLSSLKLPKYKAWMSYKVSQWTITLWEFSSSRGIKLLN